MNKIPSRLMLSRRAFLKVLVAAGAITAGGYGLVEVAPWLDYDEQANRRLKWPTCVRSSRVRWGWAHLRRNC